ncbi:MAG: trypsin-like peptidase domain-containing protein, partial [Myxococcales bacterium]|nr:trypsin-like peptidase domain-containing protein [Myxococcales bacterium]
AEDEAIVLLSGRPSLLIRENNHMTAPSPWDAHLAGARDAVQAAIRAVGRVELREHPELSWAGTGWLLAPTLVVTNCHVANWFAHQNNGRPEPRRVPFSAKSIEARLDLREEAGVAESDEFKVEQVLYMFDDGETDLAFLRVRATGSDGERLPAPIRLADRPPQDDELVVAIGYPSSYEPAAATAVRDVFGIELGVKRLSPGTVMSHAGALFKHDCSTLGGSSGSVVLSLTSGEALGVHAAGSFRRFNVAITATAVREHLRRAGLLQEYLDAERGAPSTRESPSTGAPRGAVEPAPQRTPTSAATRRVCALRPMRPRWPTGLDRARLEALAPRASILLNGTTLRYYFFDQPRDRSAVKLPDGRVEIVSWVGDERERAVVREAFQRWRDVGIGLTFKEVRAREHANVRIGFQRGDGSWSYVGRDVLDITNHHVRTMNFGWALTGDDGLDTALHEIGHTLGLVHEHQSPHAGIVWDEAAVLKEFGGPPNCWEPDQIKANILDKLDPERYVGTDWDKDSIMHYPFGPGLIRSPAQHRGGLEPRAGLSERDEEWVRRMYPLPRTQTHAPLRADETVALPEAHGQQREFAVTPEETRRYTIRTRGAADVLMGLFDGSTNQLIAADDDSGHERNATLDVQLEYGRRYVLRVLKLYDELGAPPQLELR